MSLTKFTYHLVFSTKQRKPVIDANIERTVYGILYGLCKDKKAYVRRIGGMADHVHLLVDIPSNISVADFVKYVKENASKTIKCQHLITAWEGWSEGYGGFTVSDTLVPAATAYIQGQKEHHRHTTFREEYISWLKDNGISPDNPYFPK